MTLSGVLIPLPVLIPLTAAALTLIAGRRPRLQRLITVVALSAVLAVCAVLVYLTDRDGTQALHVGGWGPTDAGLGPLGITLVADRLSALMLVVSAIVLLAVVFYAIGQGIRDGDDRQPVSIFLPTYLVLSAGVCTAFLAGDLFNLYVGFEVLLSASFVLLTIGASQERVRAGISYVMVSMVSSLIFLIGLALIYAATGTLNMAELSLRLHDVSGGTRNALFAVLLVAFGIKAAVFPLSAWLPDSYPTAPAPVTAVFAGLLTKVGVYAIIRAHSLLFPAGGLDRVLLVAALLTMLVGILGAIAQSDIKRLLSFTLISHIGYMVFGIALSSRLGMSGAIYHVAHHIIVQTTLFLVVGLIERALAAGRERRHGAVVEVGRGDVDPSRAPRGVVAGDRRVTLVVPFQLEHAGRSNRVIPLIVDVEAHGDSVAALADEIDRHRGRGPRRRRLVLLASRHHAQHAHDRRPTHHW